MVIMDGGRRGGGEIIMEEENENFAPSSPQEIDNVIQEMLSAIESVAQLGDYRRTQKKECYGLVRRMKLLLPLIDEIRELDTPISETNMAALCNLKKALVVAKKLLKLCNEGSKIYLVG